MGTWFDIVVPYFKVTRELTSLLECFPLSDSSFFIYSVISGRQRSLRCGLTC